MLLCLIRIYSYNTQTDKNGVCTFKKVSQNYHNWQLLKPPFLCTGEVIFVSAAEGNAVSLTTALFPSLSSSSLPPNKLLNMSFSCATGQLDVHVQLTGTMVLIPQVLSFTDVTLSVRMHIGSKVIFNTLILSGETQLFGTDTFVAVKYDSASKKFSVPPSLVLSVSQISSHISSFKTTLDTLPSTASELLSSRITAFSYNSQTMELSLSTTVPQVSLIPNVVMLTNAKFSIQAVIGSSPSLESLMFSGMWEIGKTSFVTNLKYNGPKQLFHVTATSGVSLTLSAKDLVQKITGNSYNLPSKLSLFTLKQIVGNIYDNGKYFIALQGTVPDGKVYVFFYKGMGGLKAGVAASVTNFKLSEVVKSTTGIDISSVPFFGQLVVPSMGLSITSGEIKSPTLPHIFGTSSPLSTYGDTLPAGVTGAFTLSIGNVRDVMGSYDEGVLRVKPLVTSRLSLTSLSTEIPGLSDALESLPSQLQSVLSAELTSFEYNTTSKELSVSASLTRFTVVPGFLSLSSVQVTYVGSIGKVLSTKVVEFEGMWTIGKYSIKTVIVYDGISKRLDVGSQATGPLTLNLENFMEDIAGNDLVLPSTISSFAFTSIRGRVTPSEALLIFNGQIGSKGTISVVVERKAYETELAVAADLASFKLADLVDSATGIDISSVPLIGSIVVPELKFAAASNDIMSAFLAELVSKGSAIEAFKNGIHKGISGQFVVEISGTANIAVKFSHERLSFTIPSTSSLTLENLLSHMPKVKSALQKLPSELLTLLSAKISSFSYDPNSKKLQFSGSLDKEIVIVPEFVALTSVSVSVSVVLGTERYVETLDITGDWILNKLPIRTTIGYSNEENSLSIAGELGGQVKIKDFIQLLSGETLPIPSTIASSVTLSKLAGNKIGDTTLISLTGGVGSATIHIIYQKSKSGSVVALAVEISKFRFASLVSSATGLDISNFPFFGTLVIPEIGFTVSSDSINNRVLSTVYGENSFLAKFGDQVSKGVTASFSFNIGTAKGVVADFANKELEVTVPDSVELSLANLLRAIPGVNSVLEKLPSAFQDIASTRLRKLYYAPNGKKLQFSGSLESLRIIPDLLTLTAIEFELSGVIGDKPAVESVHFKGTWELRSLSLTTDVTYDKNVIVIDAFPTSPKGVNVEDLIKGFSGTEIKIPSIFNELKFNRVTGTVNGDTISIVLLAKVGEVANFAIVYEKVKDKKTVAVSADVQSFKLAELVEYGSGVDISNVPFFGDLTIPALSFVLCSDQLSTATLPDIEIPGISAELLLENIPKGLKGQFLLDIGKAAGLNAEYADNILTVTAPSSVSLSLATLISLIPSVKSTIDNLPPPVKDILSAKITKLVFNPVTKDLEITLYLSGLNAVPNVIALKDVTIRVDMNLQSTQGQSQELATLDRSSPYIASYAFGKLVELDEQEMAALQAVTINVFEMKATWVIRSVSLRTEVTYETNGKKLFIKGYPTDSSGLSIVDLINGFGKVNLQVPSIISSLKITQVIAQIDDYGTFILISARTGSTEVYLVFDVAKTGTNVAVAADIEEFKLADLIKTATGADISKVPFIGSFIVTNMAFTVATDTIYSNHFTSTFDPDSELQEYGKAIPKGLTAVFKAEIGGKFGIEVTYAEKVIDFSVPPATSLTLQGLLSEIPSFEEAVKGLPSPISDLLSGKLEAIRYDQTASKLSVAAHFPQITIIPKILTVQNLNISVIAQLGSTNRGVDSLEFSGDWVLRSINIRIKVSYDRAIGEILFAAIPREGLSIGDLVTGLSGTTLPIPSAVNSVKLTKIVGRKLKERFTFIFSGTIAGTANVHLLYQKYGTTSNIAIAVGIKSFKLADLVKSAANIDITPVPFFGTFSVPVMAFSIAKNELSTPLLPQVLSPNSPLTKYGTTLPSGFTAEFEIAIGGVNGVMGSYVNKVLTFTVPDNVDVSIGSLASQIPGVDVGSLNLPSVLGDILKIRLHRFSFDIPQKVMTVEVLINKITFFENLLSISETSLKLIAKLSPPRSLSAEVKGIVSIAGTDLDVHLRKSELTQKYVITIKAEVLPIFGIAKGLGADLLPGDLNAILGQVFNFKILDAVIEYPFGVTPQQILISGTPQLWGLKTIHITAIGVKYGGRVRIIQKYSFGQFNIATFIQKLLGISLHKIFILDQNTDIAFIVAPVSVPPDFIKLTELKGLSISKGISFRLPIGFPPDCSKDAFCAVCQSILGKNARLLLEATIVSTKSFRLTAAVNDLRLGGGVILQRAGIQIEAGPNPSIGIVGFLKLSKPAITLGAAIRLTPGGVKLEGTISGCIPNIFATEYVTVCNLLLSVTLIPAPSPVTGLEFGGRIELGKKSCGSALTAEGYIGISVANPSENYFYVNIGKLTFQLFLDAFCIGAKLPRPLAESGFPDGIRVSFSLLGKELPHASISIPVGFFFKGAINILGLRAYAYIKIQPNRIKVKAGLPPLNVAGLFKMYASRSDRSRGPYVIVDIGTSNLPYIEASGYAEVLGMSAEIKILISSSKYEYSINGKFLNLFYVGLHIQASYGNLANANFVVEGLFKNDLFDKIAAGVRDGLKRSADEADRHIKAAQNKIRDKKEAFYRADRAIVNAQRKVDDAKRAFDHAIAQLEHARRRARNICHIRSCGSCKFRCTLYSYTVGKQTRVQNSTFNMGTESDRCLYGRVLHSED